MIKGGKKFFRVRNIVILSLILIVVLFLREIRPRFYYFVNDTPNRITGYVIGSSSPSGAIEIAPGGHTFYDATLRGAELLDATPYMRLIRPTTNLWLLKIVKISQLQKYENP